MNTPPVAVLIMTALLLNSANIGYADAVSPSHTEAPSAVTAPSLPPAGTQWVYTSDNTYFTSLTLDTVDGNQAIYKAKTLDSSGSESGNTTISEHIDTYTSFHAFKGQRILIFPLEQGKHWQDEHEGQITVHMGDRSFWTYHYQAAAYSRIAGKQQITVGAGTFDTWVVERNIRWTKSDPKAIKGYAVNFRCETPACNASGVTKEVLWYAPDIGRVILKAVSISGSDHTLALTPDFMLKNYNALQIELVGFSDQPARPAVPAKAHYAGRGGPFIVDFPIYMNTTWEFRLIHHAYIE